MNFRQIFRRKKLSTMEIYAAVVLVKVVYDLHGFGPVSAWIKKRLN